MKISHKNSCYWYDAERKKYTAKRPKVIVHQKITRKITLKEYFEPFLGDPNPKLALQPVQYEYHINPGISADNWNFKIIK